MPTPELAIASVCTTSEKLLIAEFDFNFPSWRYDGLRGCRGKFQKGMLVLRLVRYLEDVRIGRVC